MQELKDVVLHVYELQTPQQQQQAHTAGARAMSFFSRMLPSVGMGAYHTELEVMGDRYAFVANAGIVKSRSRDNVPPGATYKEEIQLGACNVRNRGELQVIIQKLSELFHANAYHLVWRNCNHFTLTLATALIRHDSLAESSVKPLEYYPEWINRLANSSKMVISHDDDIVPCNPIEEARKAVGADQKVGWDFSKDRNKKSTTKGKQEKKELTEKQKALLAKIRKK
jgi:hypothetical protein